MASKLKDYIEFSYLSDIFNEKYGSNPNVRNIVFETRLPLWFILELRELGYIGDKPLTNEALIILKTAMFCSKSQKFIKNSINRLSSPQRKRLMDNRKKSKFEQWICSRVDTYRENGRKISVKQIYQEALPFFPSLSATEPAGFNKLKKTIESYKRKLRRHRKP